MSLNNLRMSLAIILTITATLGCPLLLHGLTRPELDETRFSTKTRAETFLHVKEWGRYRILVESPTGAALELVDRMAGPIARAGQSGSADGIIDFILDRGDYKIRLYPDEMSKGEVKLRALTFAEKNQAATIQDLPPIVDGDFIETTLADLEQRSFWIHVPEDGPFHLEIMGRYLEEARLWRDGIWLDDKPVFSRVTEVETGKPMVLVEVNHELTAGHYLLSCYGGKGNAWALDGSSSPLYIRRGVPFLGEAGCRKIEVSAFGSEVFWVSGDTDFFQLIREDLKDTRMLLSPYTTGDSRYQADKVASISSKSPDPWCSIDHTYGGKKQWLVVQAQPGDELELCYFKFQLAYEFPYVEKTKKTFWISSLQSIEGRSTIDVTPLLFNFESFTVAKEPDLRIGSDRPMVRRINLLERSNVYLVVEDKGTYRILENPSGAKALYRFIPFENVFSSETLPDFQPADEPFELTEGTYIFNLEPERRGILHFALYREGDGTGDKAGGDRAAGDRAGGNKDSTEPQKLLESPPERAATSFIWPRIDVNLDREDALVLFLNERAGVTTGFTVRELPVDLRKPLTVRLDPGQSVEIPIRLWEDGIFTVESYGAVESYGEAGKSSGTGSGPDSGFKADSSIGAGYEISTTAGRLESGSLLQRGPYTVKLENTGVEPGSYLLAVKSRREPPPRPEIKKPDELFPLITLGDPVFMDFERKMARQFLLRVREAALYRIETSGRLEMGLTVRTPLNPRLFSASANGDGRNALVEAYLKPGDYLVEAKTLGLSRGRAGLHLLENPILEAGRLEEDHISRKTVEPDSALRYEVRITEAGRYGLSTFGLGTSFDNRLEDSGGWPIGAAIVEGNINRYFDRGRYLYYTLPMSLRTRRLTFLERLEDREPGMEDEEHRSDTEPQPQEESAEGIELFLNRKMNHTWMESPGRDPDVYILSLSAPVRATLSLKEGMEVFVFPMGEEDFRYFLGGKERRLDLDMGRYEFRVRSIETNNRFPYFIQITTEDLIPGLRQSASGPSATFPVSLGRDQHVDIWSFGRSDIKGCLLDEEENLIAENDDMKDDWNFLISRSLKQGRYSLKVEQVGHGEGFYTVSIEARNERVLLPGVEPGSEKDGERDILFSRSEEIRRTVLSVPVSMSRGSGLVRISASAEEPVSIALYTEQTLIAEGTNRIFIPLRKGLRYNLKFWHRGDSPLKVEIEARLVLRGPNDGNSDGNDGKGEDGATGARIVLDIESVSRQLPAFAYLLNNSNLSFTMKTGQKDILYSPGFHRPCSPVGRYPENTIDREGWLVRDNGQPIGKMQFEPLALKEGREVSALMGDLVQRFILSNTKGKVALLEVDSPGKITGASVLPEDHLDNTINWNGFSATPSHTVAAIPDPGSYRARIWGIRQDGDRGAEYRVSLRVGSYPLVTRMELEPDRKIRLTVEPGTAVSIELPNPGQTLPPSGLTRPGSDLMRTGTGYVGELDVLLTEGMVAFVRSGKRCDGILVAHSDAVAGRLAYSGGSLVLVNRGRTPALASVESGGSLRYSRIPVNATRDFEGTVNEPGNLVFAIEPGEGQEVLCVAGDTFQALLKAEDGNFYSGSPCEGSHYRVFPAYRGKLEVRHERGYLKVWLSSRAQADKRFVEREGKLEPVKLDSGGTKATASIDGGPELWNFSMDQEGFVVIDTTAPGVTALYKDHRILAVTAAGSGTDSGSRLIHHLKADVYSIYYRPIDNGRNRESPRTAESLRTGGSPRATGTLRLRKLVPEILPGGQPRIIGPGEIEAFKFFVRERGKIGVGLGVDSDLLQARIYSESFIPLAHGSLIFEELEDGHYFLIVEGSNRPVRYRPVVLGLEGSLQDVPDEIIREYLMEGSE